MNYGGVVERMIENGWRNLIPLTRAKGTHVRWGNWQHRDMTEVEMRHLWQKHRFCERTGMVFGSCRSLVAVDIDIEEERSMCQTREVVSQHLPHTDFIRIGRPPKRLLLFRGKVRSVKPHPIEIFGHSCQVAIFGPHPTAGKDYEWPLDTILDCTPEDLPEVTQEQIDAFLGDCIRHVTPRRRNGSPVQWFNGSELAYERKIHGPKACVHQIKNMSVGARHNTMLPLTGYLVERGHTVEEIVEFVEKWFPQHLRSEEWADVTSTTAKMAQSAIDNGWQDADWEMTDE